MAHALRLGRRGDGAVAGRTPPSGCVIVKDGRVVGRGRTQDGGRPHAEVVALAEAGKAAFGATAYVTLEPCAHHGKTPPCAEALVRAGVARVVAPMPDPDTRVAGKGFDRLRKAGIEVTTGVLAEEAARDHAGFVLRVTKGRPMVTLKLASSFDGRIATATGESQWITGPEARRAVHGLRACHDAVMVGAGTARADDPSLTVRGWGDVPQPVRVVVSRLIDVPLMSKLASSAREVPVWVVHGSDAAPTIRKAWDSCGARLVPGTVKGGRIEPETMLARLGEAGLTRVFCEGGGQLAASLLAADLVDELVGFTAGMALGAEGRPGIGAMGVDSLAEAPRFELVEARPVGGDVMHRWRRT
ncbi:bifunctional diaminohydroxyphosphoribosylaminopyrimidine deaminase/5-amino-6-(5-phosphoribosylamino)uracil reductase RibD [Salipiger mucosus]|uniref:Riboflavin biosynthesis protein RibD n=1 Tax=Salipiger mucosus DSM 16094 TaxID=1123237 RepID=S9S5Z3_9RHOB|nr:bifunctional diaminohydroxyphosphoribosylaminopyrimidine deaminase/5-amino-6-(5-phosphoribosylamino)uracil reductase RibD [Salipiger mucosus]EPX85585.1 Diaminohydroxyphosphoribosylaminopyrimidine deaminase / 5-amino-6-uracil reductase [Salipiger mucosus DSM 16094]